MEGKMHLADGVGVQRMTRALGIPALPSGGAIKQKILGARPGKDDSTRTRSLTLSGLSASALLTALDGLHNDIALCKSLEEKLRVRSTATSSTSRPARVRCGVALTSP
jgi:hypothetical protein